MRPLSLEMTAFGSYADKTVVPFEQMKHGLYLVTGDTGAGKTTIFDAIVFALFGTASGPDRKGDMLHCDFVSKSEDTVVTLRFLHNGKEFTVTRTLHFRKKRGTDEYGESTVDAELHEPDCAPIKGASAVTRRVEALLGLNAEQFCRIIMLAQGEFKRFLKANSDEKNEILGKLFDNSAYLYYQNLILGARSELARRRKAQVDEVSTLMHTLFLPPEDLDDTAREGLLPEHPALLGNLTALIEAETRRESALRAEETAALQTVNAASERLGAAEAVNDNLAALEKARAELAALEARSPEMQRREAQLRRTDDAFHKAVPAIRRAGKAEQDRRTTADEIDRLLLELQEKAQALQAAADAVEADAPLRQERTEVQTSLRAIADQLPRYLELRQEEQKHTAAEQAAETARTERLAEEQKRDALDQALSDLRGRLETLSQVDVTLQACRTAFDAAEAYQDAVSGEKGLCRDVERVRQLEKKHAEAEALLRSRTAAAADAQNAYNETYQRFIASQAGFLAERLRGELKDNPAAQCPVCGSQLCREHLPQLAVLPAQTPDQQTVDAAKKKADRTERERGEQYTAVQTCLTEIDAAKDSALSRAEALFGACENWEQLSEAQYLASAAASANQRVAQAQAALDAAKRNQALRDQSKALLEEKQRERDQTASRIEALRETEQTQTTAAQTAEAAAKALRQTLRFESAAEAEAEQRRLTAREAEIAALVQAHDNARETASRAHSTAQGTLGEKQAALQKFEAEAALAAEAETAALQETGFAAREEALAALAPIGDADGERWLRAEREALTRYHTETETLRKDVDQRALQCDGLQKAELEALQAEIARLQAESETARAAHTALENLLNNHRSVLLKVEAAKRGLAETDAPARRLERLAALAGGASSEQGKLSFDRYVMGAMFREILEMANRRMELMSGGRYELVHRAGAERRNAKAGLEIEVLDHNTGQQRPSGSLSGGESFFTSLSLALGLSDVVQNHAGGRQMDALFIDEGFGSLSDDVLDKALDVLGQLSEGSRLVGIISHVDRLDECIPQKIRVKTGRRGSTLSLETA